MRREWIKCGPTKAGEGIKENKHGKKGGLGETVRKEGKRKRIEKKKGENKGENKKREAINNRREKAL